MDIRLPPLCPVCGGGTALKEMHKSSRLNSVTCFFRCTRCATEYPRAVDATDSRLDSLRAGTAIPLNEPPESPQSEPAA